MSLTDLLIIAASTWYVAYTLTSSDGPFQVFAWLREHLPHGREAVGHAPPEVVNIPEGQSIPEHLRKTIYEYRHNGLLDCPLCLSIWVALVFVLAPVGWLTYAFATAGVAMLLHGYTGWRTNY